MGVRGVDGVVPAGEGSFWHWGGVLPCIEASLNFCIDGRQVP